MEYRKTQEVAPLSADNELLILRDAETVASQTPTTSSALKADGQPRSWLSNMSFRSTGTAPVTPSDVEEDKTKSERN